MLIPTLGPGLVAANDRLLQLIIKGILYESCVDYCQQKATASKNSNSIEFTNILSQSEFNDSDLSLLSWLQSLPPDTFSCPFEQRSLNVDVERIQKPVLETSWTEHMLVTPIRSLSSFCPYNFFLPFFLVCMFIQRSVDQPS